MFFLSNWRVPCKWYPILDQNYLISIPYPRLGCSKTLSFTVAHTYIACIWEYPSPPDFTISHPLSTAIQSAFYRNKIKMHTELRHLYFTGGTAEWLKLLYSLHYGTCTGSSGAKFKLSDIVIWPIGWRLSHVVLRWVYCYPIFLFTRR